MSTVTALFTSLTLPCGVVLQNRIAKAAMSDSLGDGAGRPTPGQIKLYETWARGGLGLSIIGEVQGSAAYPEKPGNLVLDGQGDPAPFQALTAAGAQNGCQLWAQLGHAGAMAYPPISTPRGPSALSLPDLHCTAMTREEVRALPAQYAAAAQRAQAVGFGGVQIHAGHGFLLSQFLSPLFNQRTDHYGGEIGNRSRLLVMIIEAVRAAVGPAYPVAVKLNASDQLEGGLTSADALQVVARLGQLGIDLIDISGGTYFPGAESASDSASAGPYFLDFARQARTVTDIPLMLTGGIKSLDMALAVLEDGAADVVGLARALVLAPDLPQRWREGDGMVPLFPRFPPPPEGGVTAWYTRALTHIAEGQTAPNLDTSNLDTQAALDWYLARDVARETTWRKAFG